MKRIILIITLSLSACAPAHAVQSEALVFTDADIIQPSGGLPACIVEVPEATFVAPLPCRDVMQSVLSRFKKLHPGTPYTIELNGESLSGA